MSIDIKTQEIIYGLMSRLKDTPAAKIAITSEFPANFEVKKITAIKTNKALKRLAKYGMKLA
ncbi:hypothetical protein PRRU23_09450 [Segatella bryantii]|uniref:Uncharacterized protein n=1 Tax=Segatella bryantii TaxID=77095 RepID=A0AA37HV08_SEGBR|nr:hypothetical protein PRRU23_09450 [Segatella bryantii]